MSQALDDVVRTPGLWCGRSWEGLVDRRYEAFQHALALQKATDADLDETVDGYLTFFDRAGIALFRDEEEWVFGSLQPTPQAVFDALEDHVAIAALTQALFREEQVGCVDLRVVHRLGEVLERHLLMEEESIRPLVARLPLTLAP